MVLNREIELKRQRDSQPHEPRRQRILCKIVRVGGNVKVPNRPGFIWVQDRDPDAATPPFHAFNVKAQRAVGLEVWVELTQNGWEVQEVATGLLRLLPNYTGNPYLPNHHSSHEWPDFAPQADAINVYPRALTMLRCYPGEGGGLTVSVAPLRYRKNGALVLFGGEHNIDLSGDQPGAGSAIYVGIYLNTSTNAIATIAGSAALDSPVVYPPSPVFPGGNCIPTALVRLDGSQTVFTEADFVDSRFWLDDADAPTDAQYLTLATDDALANERVFTPVAPLSGVDNGAGNTYQLSVGAASESASGVAEIATQTETNTGTDDLRIVTPAKLTSATTVVHPARAINTTAPLSGGGDLSADRTLTVGAASESASGVAELATQTETNTGTDDARIVTPLKLATRLGTVDVTKVSSVWESDGGGVVIEIDATGNVVFNDSGADRDVRMEGDTNVNLFSLDAGNDRIGIGTASPDRRLDVEADENNIFRLTRTTSGQQSSMEFYNQAQNWNTGVGTSSQFFFRDVTAGLTIFVIEAGAPANSFYIRSGGNVGIGASPTTTSGAIFQVRGALGGQQYFEASGIGTTAVTIIPDGTPDVTVVCEVRHITISSAGGNNTAGFNVANGGTKDITIGGSTWQYRVNANGSFDVRRTAGTDTATVVLNVIFR